MGARFELQYVTIAQSATVSDTLAIKHAKEGFVSVPEVNSCVLKTQASWDTTSANFCDVIASDGATRWSWQVNSGMVAIPLFGLHQFPYLRFEAGVAQSDVRTFVIGVKL